MDHESRLLFLKLLLSPLLMIIVWRVGLWKADWAGRVAAFPLVGGPILLALGEEYGVAFAEKSAKYAILGILPLACFGIIYTQVLKRLCSIRRSYRIVISLLIGWLGFLCIAALILLVTRYFYPDKEQSPHLVLCLIIALSTLLIAPRCVARIPADSEPCTAQHKLLEPGGRVIGAMILVGGTTYLAWLFGPAWSGILASFPVALSVVLAFTIRTQGPEAAHTIVQGYVYGLFGYMAFLSLFAATMPRLGLWLAFWSFILVPLGIQLLHHYVLQKWKKWHSPKV